MFRLRKQQPQHTLKRCVTQVNVGLPGHAVWSFARSFHTKHRTQALLPFSAPTFRLDTHRCIRERMNRADDWMNKMNERQSLEDNRFHPIDKSDCRLVISNNLFGWNIFATTPLSFWMILKNNFPTKDNLFESVVLLLFSSLLLLCRFSDQRRFRQGRGGVRDYESNLLTDSCRCVSARVRDDWP